MSLMNVKYLGNLKTEGTHNDSGAVIQTSAPKDNQGEGDRFSPTDLLCASLASCKLTIMGIKAKSLGVDLNGVEIGIQKIMTSSPPRKIAEIILKFKWNGADQKITTEQMDSLKRSAELCPVALSLDPSVKKTIHW